MSRVKCESDMSEHITPLSHNSCTSCGKDTNEHLWNAAPNCPVDGMEICLSSDPKGQTTANLCL